MTKLTRCKTCGAMVASSARICPSCGAKNKPSIFKRAWFWIMVVFIGVPMLTVIVTSMKGINQTHLSKQTNTTNSMTSSAENKTISPIESVFDGDCGISASAEMGVTIIGYPELSISIQNKTEKDIAAIQFYAVPYDVYGDELTGWTTQKKLYTDNLIKAGETDSISYQLIDHQVKIVRLYVYSVYFSDGTEWGDKDATKSVIFEKGATIKVSGES